MTTGTLLLLGALAALAIAAPRLGFRTSDMRPTLRAILDTGAVFIFVGALLGPQAGGLFTQATLVQLSPLLVLGLSWIGFLFGSHFEWRLLRRYPPGIFAAGFLIAGCVLALVAGATWWLLPHLLPGALPPRARLEAALVLGMCASGTAPAGVFRLTTRRLLTRENLNALRFFAAVDDLPAIVALGVLHAFLRPGGEASAAAWGWFWLALSIVMGLTLGLLTHWIFPKGDDVRHNFLTLLGVTALGGGAAASLGLSPLFVSALAGAGFANLSPRKEMAYGLLAEREHSLYVVFLLVAGMLLRPHWGVVFVLAPAMLLLRVSGKLAAGALSWRIFLARSRLSPWIGAGLLFQGGLAMTLAISFVRSDGSTLLHEVATAVVVTVLVSELLAPYAAARALGRRPAP